jgi:nucleoid DNA-binding protein
MNKGDLVNEVAKVVSTKKEAQAAVGCVFESITKALKGFAELDSLSAQQA